MELEDYQVNGRFSRISCSVGIKPKNKDQISACEYLGLHKPILGQKEINLS